MPAAAPRDRRSFLQGAGLATFGALLGTAIPFGRHLPPGLVPVALAQDEALALMAAKAGLTLLSERPVNAETPPELLDDEVTPSDRLFVRLGGLVPPAALTGDAAGWTLTLDGEVERPLSLSLDDLRTRFETVTSRLVLECAGNGRAFFEPPVEGLPWSYGAVGCPEWTGVRLADLLAAAGLKASAAYTGHYGNDLHLSGEAGRDVLSRGVPIAKALDPANLVVWAMNSAPLPPLHGFPLRLVIPGYPGSVSQKFLTRIWVRDREHDGAQMGGFSYRLPSYPVAPGGAVPEDDMEVMGAMPVKSLITFPAGGAALPTGLAAEARGHAWCGSGAVAAVHVSLDFGQTWQAAALAAALNPFAWQRWRAQVTLPEPGYYELWARATDRDGISQPPVAPGWNPRGYANNMVHRVAIFGM